MATIIKQVRRTHKYRMYDNDKRNQHLFNQIDIAGIIWNHCLALQKCYYRLTGGYIAKHISANETDLASGKKSIHRQDRM
ncbi:MAG: helix-turn-helix domain-containing protein [Aggregatilineales bacterium]